MNSFISVLLSITFTFLSIETAYAQNTNYPNKAVKLIVSFAPGGSVDVTARQLGAVLTEHWKQSVIIETRAGADGNIAAEMVARSTPDGYTLLITSNAISITPALRKLPFNPISDLKAITRISSIPNFLVVHPSLPVNNIQELIAYAKSKPGELSFASSGTGTGPFMGMALLQTQTGIRMTHIPYKGSAPAVMATLGNQTQLMFGDLNSTYPHVKSGKLKILGVSSLQRSALAPEVPTVSESGITGFEIGTWVGVFAPANTPKSIVDALSRDIDLALKTPAFQEKIKSMGAQLNGDNPETFANIMKSDIDRWTRVVRELDIKATD
jgi:tripartite-type tricarboxylate transporter receptor subunit TctC